MDAMKTSAAVLGVCAAMGATLTGAAHAVDEGDDAPFSAAANIDTSGNTGLVITARDTEHSLKRVRLRYDRGVSVSLSSSTRRRAFATVTLADRSGNTTTAAFSIPAGSLARRFSLVSTGDVPLRAKVGRGSEPSITVYDFPASIRSMEFNTVGSGTSAVRLAACRDGRRRASGDLRVSRIGVSDRTVTASQSSTCGRSGGRTALEATDHLRN